MKTFEVRSRYGTKYRAVLVDDNTIHFFTDGANYVRAGSAEQGDLSTIGFIDPEGGPFIALFETPAFCLHRDLPDREITEIVFDKDHYVIKLGEEKKKVKKTKKSASIRKPKIGSTKLLKPSKSVRN